MYTAEEAIAKMHEISDAGEATLAILQAVVDQLTESDWDKFNTLLAERPVALTGSPILILEKADPWVGA